MSTIRPLSPQVNVTGCALYLLGSIRLCTQTKGFISQSCWANDQQQAIFIYLALNRDHIVSAIELRQQFWPYLPAEDVDQEVTAVSQTLANILEIPHPILHLKEGYQLLANITLWADSEEFDVLLSQANHEPNCAHRRELLQQAVNLYQDDFLNEIDLNQKWIIARRAQLQQGYLTALQQLSALHAQAGDLETAQTIYLNALKAKPFSTENGRSFLHLIQTHSSPNQTLRHCQRLISLLQNELEILLDEYTESLAASEHSQESGKG